MTWAIICLTSIMTSCTINSTKSKQIEDDPNQLYRILVGEKYGYIDENGQVIIEPQFDESFIKFTDGVCFARIGEHKGLIDTNGNFIVDLPDSVLWVYNFHNNFSNVWCGYRKYGIIDKNGNLIIPAIYDDVVVNIDDTNTYMLVKGGKDASSWFMANDKGEIIGEKCDSILHGFVHGLCAVKRNGKWGYMDTTGTMAIKEKYDFARIFTEDGLARVRIGDKHYFIDRFDNILLEVDQTITGFTHNRAIAIINGEKCLIDRKGNKIRNIDADEVSGFQDDGFLATLITNGKVSIIDTLGNVVLSTSYDYIGEFICNVAPVKKNNKWGYIDRTGKEIVSVNHDDYIGWFRDSNGGLLATVTKDGLDFYITYYDMNGNPIWQDIPSKKLSIPWDAEKEDFIEYFDSRLSELDPIEGIYYVTHKTYYQDRENLNSVGLNNTHSQFYAIAREEGTDDFWAHCTDGSNKSWVNKFVRIGDSNNYAILKRKEDSDFSSEGRVTIEDPTQFEFRLEQGHNDWYNFFVTYEFVKDYPPASVYEKIRRAEWSGTGFAIADGYIVTNYHVTSGANTLLIRGINGNMDERYKGYVVASDKEHDLSIIKIIDKDFETLGTIPYSIGNTTVDVGDDIFVLGYPMTTTMGEEIKLTDGIISSATGYKGDESLYQISAPVQPGNSGGPLYNSDGTVVGIICGKHSGAENANYAIKTSYLFRLIKSSDLGIDLTQHKNIKADKLSTRVEKIKNYVYQIECSSK